MAIAHLSRRYHFSAAHRLHVDTLSAAENQQTFGKCNNPFGHGHNYVVQVTFSGPVSAETGMVTDLAGLDAFARSRLLDVFDHANLNLLPAFQDRVSTTENLSLEVWRIFSLYADAQLQQVHIEETGNNSFDYSGPGAQEREAYATPGMEREAQA